MILAGAYIAGGLIYSGPWRLPHVTFYSAANLGSFAHGSWVFPITVIVMVIFAFIDVWCFHDCWSFLCIAALPADSLTGDIVLVLNYVSRL